MRRGRIHRLHAGAGWIVSWRWHRRRGQPRPPVDSFFFCPHDCDGGGATFDALVERDLVEFLVVEPEPAQGPRAFAVRLWGRA